MDNQLAHSCTRDCNLKGSLRKRPVKNLLLKIKTSGQTWRKQTLGLFAALSKG
jgi:hypothetical protein